MAELHLIIKFIYVHVISKTPHSDINISKRKALTTTTTTIAKKFLKKHNAFDLYILNASHISTTTTTKTISLLYSALSILINNCRGQQDTSYHDEIVEGGPGSPSAGDGSKRPNGEARVLCGIQQWSKSVSGRRRQREKIFDEYSA